ncbi:MAG: GNAT family protein [Alphaproteobacteria bacterium]
MRTTAADASSRERRLKTDRLLLRRPAPTDARAIEALVNDEDVARFTANIPHPYPFGAAIKWIAGLSDSIEIVWAIERLEDATLIGCVGMRLVREHRTAIPGYWIGKPYWGRGYATEALGAVLAYAFDVRRVARVDIRAMPGNGASIRVQEKLGFVLTGMATETAPARGGTMDVEVRTLTRAAYEARRL